MNKAVSPIIGATHAGVKMALLRLDITGGATPAPASTSVDGYIGDLAASGYVKGFKRISAGLWEFKSTESFKGPVLIHPSVKCGSTIDIDANVSVESMTDSTPTFRINLITASTGAALDPGSNNDPSVYITIIAADSGANL